MKIKYMQRGFTLIELLVVILIIGVLAAIALPMYQKAVLKSRFAALMPIGKSMADSNEAYYLEHGQYASNPQDLPVQGQKDYDDGTSVDLVNNDDYAYALVYNETNLPDNNYLAFQKHSPKFADTTMCEARDEEAGKVCLALGGTDLGGGVTPNWTAYLLSGDSTGSNFCPTGATCNSQGEITECPSGKTLNNGACVACDIAHAASCSTTSYAATKCNTGYRLSGSVCEEIYVMTSAEAQSFADAHCKRSQGCIGIPNNDGTVSVCEKAYGKIDSETGKCVSRGGNAMTYEYIYDPDGNEVGSSACAGYNLSASDEHCYGVTNIIPTEDGTIKMQRTCADKAAITKEGGCTNGYSSGFDATVDSHGKEISRFTCSTSTISTSGECNGYTTMQTYDNVSYSTNGKRSYVQKKCATVSASNPGTTCRPEDYQPILAYRYNEAGSALKIAKCSDNRALQADGTCAGGESVVSYDSETGETTTCGTTAASVNWETATCKTL